MEGGVAVVGSGAEVNLDWQDRSTSTVCTLDTSGTDIIRLTYDHDNSPPKFVQGYKFNIFYADLVDKIQTPRYDVVPDRINGEKCIIKFHAEPPYEDVVR
ncbi:hypothetical protein WN944_019690 [Citrus x changshan-huyou]|uniref:Splicing factor Cactin C-terminal domain-containing protein n=1 Tax=Citrus x changshan-huyou TaxID=2935761 RepID=A0AAP0M0F0_9ROSI